MLAGENAKSLISTLSVETGDVLWLDWLELEWSIFAIVSALELELDPDGDLAGLFINNLLTAPKRNKPAKTVITTFLFIPTPLYASSISFLDRIGEFL